MKYLDEVAQERHLNEYRNFAKMMASKPIQKYLDTKFQGGLSPDFYNGMMAGAKAYMALMDATIGREYFDSLSEILLDLNCCIVKHIKP